MVLEAVVDHTNVGAAFRSAAALGMGGALLDPRCADPLYRRSIKVSIHTTWLNGKSSGSIRERYAELSGVSGPRAKLHWNG